MKRLLLCVLAAAFPAIAATPPVVSNVRASQRAGTKFVDILYDLSDADGDVQTIQIQVSADGGATYAIPCVTVSGDVGAGIQTGTNRSIIWNAGIDWNGQLVPSTKIRITAHDGTFPPPPADMIYVPPGPFMMGDVLNENLADSQPVRAVMLDGFFMDRYEMYFELSESLEAWGRANGYTANSRVTVPPGTLSNRRPVDAVTWYDAVKLCNARSEKEGLTAVYYADTNHTQVYRAGEIDLTNSHVKWDANGYRLPTEAEWEKASRGGVHGQRYPWGEIMEAHHANYYGTSNDRTPVGYYNGTQTPAGADMANGYGLYDMCGNVSEWCWDWYDERYYGMPDNLNNPKGPATGTDRVNRGGNWRFGPHGNTPRARAKPSASTSQFVPSGMPIYGFRCVRRAP